MVLADDISVCDTKQQQCLDGPRCQRCNSIGQFRRKFENSKKNSMDNKMCTSQKTSCSNKYACLNLKTTHIPASQICNQYVTDIYGEFGMCKTCGKYVRVAKIKIKSSNMSFIVQNTKTQFFKHTLFFKSNIQTIQPTHRICSPQSAHKALRAKATWKKNSRVSMGVRTKSDMPCSRYKVDLKAKEFGVRLRVRVLCQS